MSVPNRIHRALLWEEIYEQATGLGMDPDSARIYASDTLEDILEAEEFEAHLAYVGE